MGIREWAKCFLECAKRTVDGFCGEARERVLETRKKSVNEEIVVWWVLELTGGRRR